MADAAGESDERAEPIAISGSRRQLAAVSGTQRHSYESSERAIEGGTTARACVRLDLGAKAAGRAVETDRAQEGHLGLEIGTHLGRAIRGNQRASEAVRKATLGSRLALTWGGWGRGSGNQERPSLRARAIRGHQRPSEAIRGHQRPSGEASLRARAIISNQMQSYAIRGNQERPSLRARAASAACSARGRER